MMKKILIGALCVFALMVVTVLPACASKAGNVSNLAAVAQASPDDQFTLKVNNQTIDLGSKLIIANNGQFMVPLNLSAEALGFTVTGDGEKNTIHMDNGTMQTDLVMGEDNYSARSSKAIGMTKPQSLGSAPKLIDGVVYVPVSLYKILLMDPNCVNVDGNTINISSNTVKSDDASSSVEIPNVMVKFSTLDEARKAAGYNFAIPTIQPDGYQMKDIVVIRNDLAEISYLKEGKRMLYRTAKGDCDISGDYNDYTNVKTITINDAKVTVKGNGNSISLATWTEGSISFSLSFDDPINQALLSTIVESIQ